ncbi:hypothetical protein [Phytoactinopolyspora halotolerans]|uniref:RHS repeat protein n=1 Tax=Phytoactinopolyspora halotolerans TaxID=1981512 RepID=A0A6L9SCY2_9ACTN|nr:hypothetical protein [Phytoactinopolyspora halotolerans]NEE02428.1 hypothetical protein [Phytoactinopolyspora halotolerans]
MLTSDWAWDLIALKLLARGDERRPTRPAGRSAPSTTKEIWPGVVTTRSVESSKSFTYDDAGQLTSFTGAAGNTSLTSGDNGRLHAHHAPQLR